jgi:hypothetical protein
VPTRPPPPSFVIPARFHPGWSLLGRALRRWTGDRLRAEALHITLLTGGALLGLMGVYAADALVVAGPAEAALLAVGGALVGVSGLLALVGLVGVRPRAAVTCAPAAVRIERGRERLRLPYAALERIETVSARLYHRQYRRWAAVRPFLGSASGPVLLLHAQDGTQEDARGGDGRIVALGLPEAQREALRNRLEARRPPRETRTQTPSGALEPARP